MKRTSYITHAATACFLFSGYSALLYQTLWLRLSMTHFGVIAPVISVVISVFMLGIGLGTWLAGKYADKLKYPLRFYAIIELFIATGAFFVPKLLEYGATTMLQVEGTNSATYLLLSSLWITACLLPWCTAMGLTFPVMTACLKIYRQKDIPAFSLLYFANVLGGMFGCISTLLLIELLGFSHTAYVAGAANLLAALVALFLPAIQTAEIEKKPAAASALRNYRKIFGSSRNILIFLFLTGFTSLGMEIIWIRMFSFSLGTTIYSFAGILILYLYFTFAGTLQYRRTDKLSPNFQKKIRVVLTLLPILSLLPLLSYTIAGVINGVFQLMLIAPFCYALGFLTPAIIDAYAGVSPKLLSRAYGMNIIGSIVGPLLTTYLLLPNFGNKLSLILLAATLVVFTLNIRKWKAGPALFFVLICAISYVFFPDLEQLGRTKNGMVHRDYTGSVVAIGEGLTKQLYVNGVGMTGLTTITKVMAHLPMSYRPKAKSALVICFGMGTTVRSLTTWPLEHITAVDLSSAVIESFPYFHENANSITSDPRLTLHVDDGRRFLARNNEKYDLITIDPPPPQSAAASGLLYSEEFIALAKSHLQPDGVLQHWIPSEDPAFIAAVLRGISHNFKHVVTYTSLEGWGLHITASDAALPGLSSEQFINRLPETAKNDLLEWLPGKSMDAVAQQIISGKKKRTYVRKALSSTYTTTDNLPLNEYFLLRDLRTKNLEKQAKKTSIQ